MTTPAPEPARVEPVGVDAVWIVLSPTGIPQPQTCRLTYEDAMRACFGRRERDRYPRDWWQHNLDEGWTCREIAIAPAPDAELAEVERENAILRAALSALPVIAEECRLKWDVGMKAGKLLIALTDPTLRYRSDITELHRVAALPTKREEAQATRIATIEATLALRDRELRDARAEGAGRGEGVITGLKDAVEIANQAYREMAATSGAWDEGMRDMAVRISHRISARIAAAPAPATDGTGGQSDGV